MLTKRYVKVVNRGTGQVLIESARWCSIKLCRLGGIMPATQTS